MLHIQAATNWPIISIIQERFFESKNHDNLKALCKIHHEFMHNGLVTNQAEDSSQWRLSLEADLSFADCNYRRYRRL